jgi:hypothetical protein
MGVALTVTLTEIQTGDDEFATVSTHAGYVVALGGNVREYQAWTLNLTPDPDAIYVIPQETAPSLSSVAGSLAGVLVGLGHSAYADGNTVITFGAFTLAGHYGNRSCQR